MPIDLYGSLKKTSQWAFGSPLLNNILSSNLFVALVISVIMILLIMIMYPAKSGTPFSIIAKMFIYMFFGTALIIFLHDSVLKYMIQEEGDADSDVNIMRNTTSEGRVADPAYASLYTPINPVPQPIPQQTMIRGGQVSRSEEMDELLRDTIPANRPILGGSHPPKPIVNPYK
jgi:hypothetical protein